MGLIKTTNRFLAKAPCGRCGIYVANIVDPQSKKVICALCNEGLDREAFAKEHGVGVPTPGELWPMPPTPERYNYGKKRR